MSISNTNTYQQGESDERPWGRWAVLAVGDGYVVKEISVKPKEILSLQSHDHRDEHWIILSGQAQVTIDDQKLDLGADETAYIPKKARHRIQNTGETLLTFIEVQTGALLDEDDIHRYEDVYGRTKGGE